MSMLKRLKSLIEALRLLAGEAHERKEAPAITWAQRGKNARAGNAMRLVSLSAKAAGETRLAQRKAEIERLAEKAGIVAQFHLRVNVKGILPRPPADVLAPLPALSIADAMTTLAELAELVRSLMDSSIHLTIMPHIGDVTFPALAKAGYQTFLPDVEGATFWAEQLGLSQAPSVMASMFGQVLGLASELGAMDQKQLGNEIRPEEEIAARRSLEAAFAKKCEELIRRLNAIDPVIKSDVLELVRYLRAGEVDFAAVTQAAISGTSSNIGEAAGYLSLILMSVDIDSIPVEEQLSDHAQASGEHVGIGNGQK